MVASLDFDHFGDYRIKHGFYVNTKRMFDDVNMHLEQAMNIDDSKRSLI